MEKRQPLTAPNDVKRYFVSPEESGQICLLACVLGKSGEIFFPKLGEEQMMRFSDICDSFIQEQGLTKHLCATDEEAKQYAVNLNIETINHKSEPWPVVY